MRMKTKIKALDLKEGDKVTLEFTVSAPVKYDGPTNSYWFNGFVKGARPGLLLKMYSPKIYISDVDYEVEVDRVMKLPTGWFRFKESFCYKNGMWMSSEHPWCLLPGEDAGAINTEGMSVSRSQILYLLNTYEWEEVDKSTTT